MSHTDNDPAGEARHIVAALVARARAAQRVADDFDQSRVDELVVAAGWAIIEPGRNRILAELAVHDTGIGSVEDKVRKNHRKTLGLLRDLQGARSVGVIAEHTEIGITEIARPVGVVCAITPSTNPGATPANKIINALKGRNAVIVAPSPKGWSTAERLVGYIHAQFDLIGAPRDLVQLLPAPITKLSTAELMRQCDLVVATGSGANVRAAYACGTPAFGVGAGNVAGIIDETADVEAAAERIVRSKTFDNATSCSSENSIVVVDAVRGPLLAALARQGAVMLAPAQKGVLQSLMWPDGKLSSAVIGQSAQRIAEKAGFADLAAKVPRILMVEEDAQDGFGPDHPFSGEKLSPVLTVYAARDFARCAAHRRSHLCVAGRRAFGRPAQHAGGAGAGARVASAGGARDLQPGALHRHRRQLRQRPAVLVVNGLRHLGQKQFFRQHELSALSEHHPDLDTHRRKRADRGGHLRALVRALWPQLRR